MSRDGESNPELNKLDRNRLGATASRVTTLALAWYFSGEEKYAQKATELDSYSFVEMLDAVKLLEQSKSFTAKDSKQLQAWFGKLLNWILTSPQGQEESRQANNHSTAYDAQVIAIALYTGNLKVAREVINAVPAKRIFTQIEPDGRQPHELRRTLAFGYSQYNLTHLLDIFCMAEKIGIRIDNATSPDGRNFYRAMDFLAQYTGKDVKEWPYQQISEWDYKQQEFCKDLYRAGLLNPARKDYLRLSKAHRVIQWKDRFNLLYVQPSEVDNAYAFACKQLEFAMQCADKAKKEEKNAARRRVMPRSIHKDGSLAMIHPHDWCSGFFPGSLWQVYAYTHDDPLQPEGEKHPLVGPQPRPMEISGHHRQYDEPGNAVPCHAADGRFHLLECGREPCQHYTEESFPSGLLLLSRSGLPPGNR